MQELSKHLVILVGPPGSGKSTFSKASLSDYTRISQDDQGVAHFDAFLRAIKRGEKVYVDRMNFSREQRSKYIKPAKDLGYEVTIYDFNKPIIDCFNALKGRTEHPTLPASSGDAKLLEVLDFYVSAFEPVQPWEGRHVKVHGDNNPYMWDVTNMARNALIIGDVHGCYDELMTLLDQVRESGNKVDLVIFCGDLVDKGPEILKTIRYFIKNKTRMVSALGNHENKFKRYLKGNKVSIDGGLSKTIKELEGISEEELLEIRLALLDMPRIVKFCDHYILHAGINPERKIGDQFLEALMYTRNWNPLTKSFNTATDPFWFEYYKGDEKICFGHQVHEQNKVKDNVLAMDGGCVHGEKLRGLLLTRVGYEIGKTELFEVYSKDIYSPKHGVHVETDVLAPYEDRVKKGLIRKVVDGDLVLYNYTDKCTFERAWDEYTIKARGIVFNQTTKEVVARPFPKFFNLNETEATQLHNLPNEKFFVYEKMDGSMGIIFNHEGKWRVATRGSFTSEQAIKGQQMLDTFIKTDKLNPELTYLTEIIYPENKIIVDYGDREALVLLGAVNTKTGEESYPNIEVGFDYPNDYRMSLDELIANKKILDKNEEGYVVKFQSGLRIKIKGDEYLKISKIMSHASPLSFWEIMVEGKVSKDYLAQIPEEILPEFVPVINKLENKYAILKANIYKDYYKAMIVGIALPDDILKDPIKMRKFWASIIERSDSPYKKIFYKILDNKDSDVDRYVMNQIKPVGNVL